ncbi:chlorohydrolase [Streptococcus pneumoniae]|uniref:hypothetical protein n=1 Tax=Streptococcus pneumoniae TaxID=1313 RepID=UPI000B6AD373|nr:hypothetical protein [Streptococcus pneumoniae]SNJ39644.1 chlorohydrolase [Streptococcus pneumoniae]
MKIKEQTRQLAAGCSKHWFEAADWIELTKSVTYIRQGNANWFEEIFEEYETKTYSF